MQLPDPEVQGDEEYEISLIHHTQKNTWDCGLSCIMMVLPEKKRNYFSENFDEICKEEGFGKSTWTIDLCYLLKRFSMKFVFSTTILGVNPEHKSQFFYEKILPKDAERVITRFKNAEKNGITVRQKSVHTREIISHIKSHGPVIVLTNAGYLTCDICKRNNTTAKLINYLPQSVNYHGHYVVLCGYNLKKKQIYYRNPAYSKSRFLKELVQWDFMPLTKPDYVMELMKTAYLCIRKANYKKQPVQEIFMTKRNPI